MDEGRLVVEYQPIIDLTAGQLVGAEALARVLDAHDDLVQPSSFLEVAEETGLLIEIDERVLADAVKQASGWRTRFGDTAIEVAINVTSRHLADAGFASSVIDALDAAGVPHGCLQVELAERTLMEASNSAITGLRTLRDAGVRVGLDDFGTGYSSLAFLRQFPLDFVKIDGSFIRDLDRSPSDRAIVAAIIGLAHALDLRVVAEAVETREQLEILEALECDRAQGYHFARSSSPDAVSELVVNGLDPDLLGTGEPPRPAQLDRPAAS
jgi:EAL domain-containing protein (putative c-di-GMP-specific phosphodiesterase class I)